MRPTVELVGDILCVGFPDGFQGFLPADFLRGRSPSAEVAGEVDVMGVRHGGEEPRSHKGVKILGWEWMGNYALRLKFSDGHQTGLYSYEYLRKLAQEVG